MIRIDLTDKAEYFSLREEFLDRISDYVYFNKEDIVNGQSHVYEVQQTGEQEDKTEKSAEELKENFPALYQFLFDEKTHNVNRKNLRELLVGPDELPQSFGGHGQEQTMKGYLKEIINICTFPDNEEKKEKAKKCCRAIFNYQKFVRNQKDAYWLLRRLNVRVCPYCNRVYTVTLPSPEELEKEEKFRASRATFDHFYCQAEYPYLALSLFNLVPSCFSCNLSKKNSAEEPVYPYDEEFGEDVFFRVVPDMEGVTVENSYNILNFLHGESERFHIRFMGKNSFYLRKDALLEDRLAGIEKEELRKSIQTSINMFNLEELYKEHQMEIKDILRNRYYFDEQYVKTVICPMLQQKIGKEKLKDEKELERMALNMLFFTRMDGSEWGKRPLSKLVADILQQVTVSETEQ